MLETLAFVVVLIGLARAIRLRHVVVVAGAALFQYLLLADGLAAMAADGAGYIHIFFLIGVAGPGAVAARAAGPLPLPVVLLLHPWVTRILRTLLSAAIAWRCLNESSRLNPLLPRAYALDGLAMPFVAACVLDLLIGISQLYTYLLMQNAAG